jgi:hypothetical protein
LGVIGLRAMGVAGHVEVAEREFLKLSQRFDSALTAVEATLLDRVQATFDPDEAESVSARLSSSIKGAHGAAGDVVVQARPRLDEELASTDAQLRDVTASIDRYLHAFEAGTMPEAICAPRLAELSDRRTELAAHRDQ